MEKEYILESPSKPIKYRKGDIFTAISDKLKTVRDDHVFFTDSASGETVRRGDMMNRMEAIASYLHQQGVRPGGHVVVYASNCVQYPEIVLACWMAGFVPACVNNLLTADDLGRVLAMTAARVVITTTDMADKALTACRTTPGQNVVVAVGDHPGCVNWYHIVQMKSNQLNRLVESAPENTALILFSSGTTGFPKAVEISHENLSFFVALYSEPDMVSMDGTGLIFSPLSHILGLGIALITLTKATTALVMPRFDMAEYVRLIVKHKVTNLILVPPLALLLLQIANKEDLIHVRDVLCGAAALPSEVEQQLNDMLSPGVKVKQIYGMTEVAGVTIHKGSDNDTPPSSIGRVVSNMQMKVVDPESGKSLPFGKTGEMCVRGPAVMKGYMNNEEATKATIDSEGWLHTGDLGYYDQNGYLFYVDRLKELIKYNAYQVAPAELENVILSHPDVADAAVVGVPDRKAGELPTAWVVIKPAAKVTPQDIQTYVKGKVASTKQLRGGVLFVQAIPKSGSGKILRRQIRKEIADSKVSKM